MNVDEALLLADDAYTGFSGHLEALRVLAAEVRRQHAEIGELHTDALRYRHLRNRVPTQVLDRFGEAAGAWIDTESNDGRLILLTGVDADVAVDTSRRNEEVPK